MSLYEFLMAMLDTDYFTVIDQEYEVVIAGKVEDILKEVPRQFLECFNIARVDFTNGQSMIQVK